MSINGKRRTGRTGIARRPRRAATQGGQRASRTAGRDSALLADVRKAWDRTVSKFDRALRKLAE